VLHACPTERRLWQTPPAAQKNAGPQSPSLVQLLGHAPATPLQRNPPHPMPDDPFASTVQLPAVTLQTSQPPLHAALQQ
jgi:hypothetical protein